MAWLLGLQASSRRDKPKNYRSAKCGAAKNKICGGEEEEVAKLNGPP
jgi:hypothetical protein